MNNNGYRIVIDAGHGGSDSGAVGNGIIEKNLTLDISKYMYDLFKKSGIPVTLIRSTDETVDPTTRVNRILSAYGNNPNVIVISNHINAGGGDGAEVIYALRNNDELSKMILDELQKEGQNIRKSYQRRLPSNMSKDYYFIHRNTGNTEPVIVEYGFLDSKGDDVNLLKNNYQNLAAAVVRAVLKYINFESKEEDIDTYTVKAGDSLWSIAKKYNLTVDQLKTINNLTNNTLKVGQVLKIAEENLNNDSFDNKNTYIVKPGDTLYSVANQYNLTVDELINYNNLASNLLSLGQVLKIPDKVENIIEIPSEETIYIVKRGDSLYSIGKQYGISAQEIMNYNNLKTNLLSINQQLKIPQKSYTVKPGDTLYQIAKSYNIDVNDLKAKNNLISDSISIGQILKI